MGKVGNADLFSAQDVLPDMILAPRTDPVYNAHGYLTKVPIDAILPYVSRFSEVGETVVDMFAGSGMTGIATQILGRRALLSDISALGQHIGTGYLTDVGSTEFQNAATSVVKRAKKRHGALYSTIRSSDGMSVEMLRAVWTFIYRCPKCAANLPYYELLRDNSWNPPKSCPKCGQSFSKSSFRYVGDKPVRVAVDGVSGKQEEQMVFPVDVGHIKKAKAIRKTVRIPSLRIAPDREMYRRSALKKWNLEETADFFSDRNALALAYLHEEIHSIQSDAIRKKLLFAFTAILPRASRRYQWHPKRPLNAANQNYYIAPVYYEWNVFDLFDRKVSAALRSDEEIRARNFQGGGFKRLPAKYVLASADNLRHINNSSVDYVFTDPPFGSNIFYSDMNLFQEAWLDKTTEHSHEAVMHTEVGRRADAKAKYSQVLDGACAEAYRVLRPGRHMSIVFGNSSGHVWSIVQRALMNSGFELSPVHVAILDKGQRSVKGLNSGREGVATLDLIVTVRKPIKPINRRAQTPRVLDIEDILERSLNRADVGELPTPSHVYLVVLKEAMTNGMDIEKLHLADVLIALRKRGLRVDEKTGRLKRTSN